MSMIIHQVVQGTPEWHALRSQYLTASEAPVMMGASKQMKRNELLHAKKTGLDQDVHWWVQRFLFDRGHEVEAMARPIVERIIGEDLYPVVGSRDRLLASMDGLTILGNIIFEHKLFNPELAEQVRAGELDPQYYWQLEQQILVSGAEKAFFVVSDGTEENMVYLWYTPVPGRAKQLLDGWKQFEADLAVFEPVIEATPIPVGRTPENLPALRIEVTGMVTASNLSEFKSHALSILDGIKTELQDDQDFADAEKTVKWCKDVEDRLAAAKQHALSQTASIDELFRTVDEIAEETRAKRLALDRLVKARKDAIRLEIKQAAELAVRKHLGTLNERLAPVQMPVVATDFAGVMKGKKTVASLQDAVDTELARFKIEANNLADKMDANLRTIRAAGYDFLFADLQALATKDAEDLDAVIRNRITEHQAREEEARSVPEPAASAAPASTPPPVRQVMAEAPTDEAPTLRLGTLCERLGFNVSAEFLRSIGHPPAGRERSAILYRESDFDRICGALIDHIESVRLEQPQAA